MVLLSDSIERQTTREILRDRRSREQAKATRRAVAMFFTEFLFIISIFALLFYGVGGMNR